MNARYVTPEPPATDDPGLSTESLDLSSDDTGSFKHQMTQDERLRARALLAVGLSRSKFAAQIGKSYRQIRTAVTSRLTTNKGKGRPHALMSAQKQELYNYIESSQEHRLAPWIQLLLLLGWDVSERTVRQALKEGGFGRRHTRTKPSISEANRKKKLKWAKEHVHWTVKDWKNILWTDETWTTSG